MMTDDERSEAADIVARIYRDADASHRDNLIAVYALEAREELAASKDDVDHERAASAAMAAELDIAQRELARLRDGIADISTRAQRLGGPR